MAPVGLAFDETGVLFVGNFTDKKIHRVVSGTATYVATVPNGDALGFITYAGGRLFGTNFGGHEIYSINPNGVDDFELYAGGGQGDDDGPITTATFDTPNGIIYKPIENALYISEFSGEGNIRKIEDAVLATPSFEIGEVAVYPNPSSTSITVQFASDERIKALEIFTVLGQVVETQILQNPSNTVELNVSHLSSGTYFLRLTTEQNVFVKSFVKE